MSLSETRFGANATPLPAVLPPISAALSRRAALFGAVTVAGASVAACSPAKGHAAALSPNDARLVELADAYEALDRQCREHSAAHDHLTGGAMRAAEAEFDRLTSGFGPLEQECAETPADSFAGVMAKARLCRSPTARGCADFEHVASVADDLWRLFGTGALA